MSWLSIFILSHSLAALYTFKRLLDMCSVRIPNSADLCLHPPEGTKELRQVVDESSDPTKAAAQRLKARVQTKAVSSSSPRCTARYSMCVFLLCLELLPGCEAHATAEFDAELCLTKPWTIMVKTFEVLRTPSEVASV